jgi:hypothetical protein
MSSVNSLDASQVQDNPDGEPDDVKKDEHPRSGESRNTVADPIRQLALMQCVISKARYRPERFSSAKWEKLA